MQLTLISLTEHNRGVFSKYKKSKKMQANGNNHPCKNGISCPTCGKELWDANPSNLILSSPPQTKTSCDCGYRGYRYC